MPALGAFLALLTVSLATPAPPPTSRVIALAAMSLEARGLDPGLQDLVPGLVSAALESGSGYAVATVAAGASWQATLAVSGKGPWHLSAQVDALGEGGRLRRFLTKKHSFSGREELGQAVDELAIEIDMRIRSGDAGEE